MFSVSEVVPHSGKMSLLDTVHSYDEESLVACLTPAPDSFFAQAQGMPASVGIEYMAQAVAAYGGVIARLAGKPVSVGFLLGTRKYVSKIAFFEFQQRLTITVRRTLQGDNGLAVFDCHICSDELLVSASLNVYQPDDANSFIQHARIK